MRGAVVDPDGETQTVIGGKPELSDVATQTVIGLVRPRLSIRVHALAPTLNQRDVLLANVVAHGRLRPLCCSNLALPLAALLVTAVW